MSAIRLILILLALAMGTAARAQAVAVGDEQQFSEDMLARFTEADRSSRFVIAEPLVLSVEQRDGQQGAVYLQRVFQFCLQASVADCGASKAIFVRYMMERPAPPSRANLRVIVRDTEYVDGAREIYSRGNQATGPLTRPIGDDLHAMIASDSPTQIAIITTLILNDLGLTEEEAWEVAYVNTDAALPAIPTIEQLQANWVGYQLPEYAASLLANPEGWRVLALAVGPELFVTAVSDQIVMVGLLPAGAELEQFKQAVRDDCAAAERCISPNLYRWRDGLWVIAP